MRGRPVTDRGGGLPGLVCRPVPMMIILLVSITVSGQEISPLVNGTPADAEVLNRNFESLGDTIDKVEARVNANSASQQCAPDQFLDSDGECNRIDRSGTCEAGRICTGGHEHALEDLVPGDLDIGEGNYSHDVRTGRIGVPGAAFTPRFHDEAYVASPNGYIRPEQPSVSFYGSAPVDLPDGAEIARIILYWYDNFGETNQIWSCSLNSRPRLSSDADVVIDRTFNGNSAGTPVVISSPADASPGDRHVVDKQANFYWLSAFVINTDGSDDYRHYGCGIEYTYTNTNR